MAASVLWNLISYSKVPTSVYGPNCGLLVVVVNLGMYFEPHFLFSSCHPVGETDVCGLCASQFSKSDSHLSNAVHSVSTTSSIYFPYLFHMASGVSVLFVTFAGNTEFIAGNKIAICFTMLQQTFWLVPTSLADIGMDGHMTLKICFLNAEDQVQSQEFRVGLVFFNEQRGTGTEF